MRYTSNALRMTKSFEGCKLKAYYDDAGVLTIGWGDTHDVYEGLEISQAEADSRLDNRLDNFCAIVTRLVKIDLNDEQFSALVDFTFNEGSGRLETSTLLQKLNACDLAGAAGEFERWDKSGGHVDAGLLERRKAEKALFTGDLATFDRILSVRGA